MRHWLHFHVGNLLRRRSLQGEIDDELQFHLEALTDENIARGMSAEEARRVARQALGGLTQSREAYRDGMTFPAVHAVLQDLRYALRALRKSPGFTLTAVLVLGLGIGLNAGLFSLIRTLCYRPLPYTQADRLYSVNGYTARAEMRRKFSYPAFETLRAQGGEYAELAAYDFYNSAQAGATSTLPPDTARVALISDNFFAVLRSPPRFGAGFLAESPSVVLSDRYWRRRFAGDPSVMGTLLQLNSQDFRIAGIMPPEFQGVDIILPDVWIRLADQNLLQRDDDRRQDAVSHTLVLLGRLQTGVPRIAATSALSALVSRIPETRPGEQAVTSVVLNPAVIFPLNPDMRPFVLLFLLPAGLVLVIACFNLANLLLARASSRRKELATRLALGAGRWRLIQQLMTESVVLALLGGITGTLVAAQLLSFGSTYLRQLAAGTGFVDPPLQLDGVVWALTLAISLLASVICGLTPALFASRQDLASATRQDGSAARATLLRNVLMAAQVAVCTILLAAAGMMLRSFEKAMATDPGFAAENILTLQYNLTNAHYSKDRAASFQNRAVARLGALPQVRSLAAAAATPLSDRPAVPLLLPEKGGGERYRVTAPYNRVSREYFSVLGIAVVAGRAFAPSEVESGAPVAMISQATANHLWPGQSPLGQRLRLQIDNSSPYLEVIGVVVDTRSVWLSRVDETYVYLPFAPDGASETALLVHVDRDLPATRTALSDTLRTIDADLPVAVQPLRDVVNQWRLLPLAASVLASAMALMALILAGVGMYGVMAYLVNLRKREFGVRIALGASRLDILSMVFGQGLRVIMGGLIAGLAGAATLARLMMGSFYGMSPYDPGALLFVIAFLGTVALAAMYGPASRATRVDPAISLRCE